MIGDRVRTLRERRGLTQAELAKRAGVSRQLVGALEAGRNLPRVDSALALADALGVDAASLFSPPAQPQDIVTGQPPTEGSALRVGTVGDKTVTSAARVEATGWDVADAVLEEGALRPLTRLKPGVVVAGCEPGLQLLERWLREAGMRAVAAYCSSKAALAALGLDRAHAAVVHALVGELPAPPLNSEVARYRLCRWRVGLAAPVDASQGWAQAALAGTGPVIQREHGAGVQAAYVRASQRQAAGPRVGSHLEAARMAVASGIPAVTIEPAALACGTDFHPLETHEAEFWVKRDWLGEPGVEAALVELSSRRFQRLLARVGGYDLEDCGVPVSAG